MTEIIAEQRLDVGEDRRIAGRVQAMASVVQPDAVVQEAAGIAAEHILLLDERDAPLLPTSNLERRAAARGAASQHDDMWIAQAQTE
jgi:hypothetical protein